MALVHVPGTISSRQCVSCCFVYETIHGEHVPAGDSGEVRETGETLEGAGELLIRNVFLHSCCSRSVGCVQGSVP